MIWVRKKPWRIFLWWECSHSAKDHQEYPPVEGIRHRSDKHLREAQRANPATMTLRKWCYSTQMPWSTPSCSKSPTAERNLLLGIHIPPELQPERPPAFERSRSTVGARNQLGRKQNPWKQNPASPEPKRGFAVPRPTSIQQSILFLKLLISHVPKELESRWEVWEPHSIQKSREKSTLMTMFQPWF